MAYIASFGGRGWRLGLDRMEAFMKTADLYEFAGRDGSCSFIHVAGTNGKGTVTAMIEAILHAAGKKVGATFSPYVVDPRERIRIGNALVSKELYAGAAKALAPIAEKIGESELGLVTEFEFKTAMAFWVWKHEGCEWAVVEVGLGGRLDATNVLQPKSGAIVSIGLDHTEHLGFTEDAIAREKAGILKSGAIGVIGEMSGEARGAIQDVASGSEVDLWELGNEVSWTTTRGSNSAWLTNPKRDKTRIQFHDLGLYTAHNAVMAVSALDAAGMRVEQSVVSTALQSVRLPGRMQWVRIKGVSILLDGAHNGPATEGLATEILKQNLDGSTHLVFGMLNGHEPRRVFAPLRPIVRSIAVTAIDYHRTLEPGELRDALEPEMPTSLHESTADALEAALNRAKIDGGIILVTGSFYLVGEAMKAIESMR